MRGSRRCRSALVWLLLTAVTAAPVAAADPPVNLLRLPQAKLEATSLVGDRGAALAALTDGKLDVAAGVDSAGGETIDLVFGFAGETVAPEAVTITVVKKDGAAPPSRIEVLASAVSAETGFRSLRADPLKPDAGVQRFAFTPAGARWLMVRLTVADPAAPVAVAEIEVLGRKGPPVTVYTFGESPARAIDILARLQSVSAVQLAVSADEKAAFDRAKAGRLDAAAFADTALLASGVLDAAKRRAYLARLEALAAKAQAAIGAGGPPAERGEALLRWLHREVLAKGYRATQTDLAVLLDEQTFNCVSSAVIYNIIALRLGLDARAIEVPSHAFSIVYEGTRHMDVETTNPQGFNPSRDPRQIARFEQLTGFRYIPDSHRDQRREVTEAGLAAIIYYNKGVELGQAKRHHDALLAYFRAMSLDAEFKSAAKNALATLANWSLELATAQQWQQALDVAAVGRALAPDDALLANNQTAVWQRWAISLADAGRPDEAIAVLKRAAAALPAGGFEAMQAWVFIKPGEALAKARQWQAALAATEAGLAKLDPAPRQELVKWRDNLFLRWTNDEIAAGRFEAAASVLTQGLTARPDDKRLRQTVAYLAQEWAKKAGVRNFTDGLAVFAGLERQFPSVAGVNEARLSYVWRHIKTLVEAGDAEAALAAIDAASDALKDGKQRRELGVFVFDTRAKALMKQGAWSDAADVYVRALKQFPDDAHLKNNVAYLAQEWQKAAYAKGGAPEVAAVSAALAEKFPNIAALQKSGSAQIRRVIMDQVRAGDVAKALETLKASEPQLTEADVLALNEFIYDYQAKKLMAAKDWPGAADAYVAGIAAAPTSNLLRTNAVYLAQEWARAEFARGGVEAVIDVARRAAAKFPGVPKIGDGPAGIVNNAVNDKVRAADFTSAIALIERAAAILPADRQRQLFELSYDRWAKSFMDKKQWPEAIDIYEKGLARLPDSGLFKNNREYCRAQIK